MGDGLLIEFASAIEAVRFALAKQKEVAQAQVSLPQREQLKWRIAIHLGDIVSEGTDLLGDGVNVVSRLQELAPPGGVLISQAIRDHLPTTFSIRPLGSRKLKNIPKPVNTFEVLGEGQTAAKLGTYVSLPQRVLVAGLILGGIGLATATLSMFTLPSELTSLLRLPNTANDTELSASPQILVMPLSAHPPDKREMLLAAGFSEEVIAGLSKFSGIRVFGRATSEALNEARLSPAELKSKHGVRYVVSGSLRISGEVFRVNFELMDTSTGLDTLGREI
jgi:TolB-like protein